MRFLLALGLSFPLSFSIAPTASAQSEYDWWVTAAGGYMSKYTFVDNERTGAKLAYPESWAATLTFERIVNPDFSIEIRTGFTTFNFGPETVPDSSVSASRGNVIKLESWFVPMAVTVRAYLPNTADKHIRAFGFGGPSLYLTDWHKEETGTINLTTDQLATRVGFQAGVGVQGNLSHRIRAELAGQYWFSGNFDADDLGRIDSQRFVGLRQWVVTFGLALGV